MLPQTCCALLSVNLAGSEESDGIVSKCVRTTTCSRKLTTQLSLYLHHALDLLVACSCEAPKPNKCMSCIDAQLRRLACDIDVVVDFSRESTGVISAAPLVTFG